MSQKKSTHTKRYKDEAIVDNILWFIENYMPHKKKKSLYEELRIANFRSFIISKIKKLAYNRSNSLSVHLGNSKITFTVGNGTLPYLNFFKRIKYLKQKFLKNINYKNFLKSLKFSNILEMISSNLKIYK